MAWVAEYHLAAAVSNAGGLGIIGAASAPPEVVREQIREAKKLTDKPFGVNVMLLNPNAAEVAQIVIEEGVKVVTTGAGNPGKFMDAWKQAGVVVIPVVASVAMARMMERGGADAVIAEGMESGGHIGAQTTMTLVPQVADAVKIPVIAAGGIADGRGMAAAFMLGAEAVQMGTRFVASKEAVVHENYKQLVIKSKDIDTRVTGRTTGHPVRAIRNEMTRHYLELEKELDKQIRQMESTHPGYDEYRYQLDEIGHDPYQLISHLTAVYEQFTRGQVKPVIKELFKQQYLLKVWETIEIRTRMETRVGIRPTIDAFGNISMETYTYQEEVEYEYKILNVLLKNKGFDTIARKNMNQKQTGRYDAYNMTYGNRPELFGAGSPTYSGGTTGSIGTGGAGGSGGGFKYDIPSEALSDEKFARMIEEAEKYLGMPYVWGGSSPSTSFDCSGFVCWVINNCGNGWSVGRTTANDLRGKCSYVSPADAQPGDLIFFEKTYNTVGASHVGIYVGNGMMIHCGDPISYTSINSTYWQSHFLGFGRIN